MTRPTPSPTPYDRTGFRRRAPRRLDLSGWARIEQLEQLHYLRAGRAICAPDVPLAGINLVASTRERDLCPQCSRMRQGVSP